MRTAEITSISAHVSLRAHAEKGSEPRIEPHTWLELNGTAEEPIRDVREVQFSLHPTDRTELGPASPPAIGGIIQIDPTITVVIGFPRAEFDRIWSLALSGQLRYASFVFTKPRYRKALEISVSSSTEPEE